MTDEGVSKPKETLRYRKGYHRRAPRACDECRLRKIKCDGSKPCKPCTVSHSSKSRPFAERTRTLFTKVLTILTRFADKLALMSREESRDKHQPSAFEFWKHGCVVSRHRWRFSSPRIRQDRHSMWTRFSRQLISLWRHHQTMSRAPMRWQIRHCD